MTFQTATNLYTAPAVPGEVVFLGPEPRVQPRIVYHASLSSYFGYVYTELTAGDDQTDNTVRPGGTGIFAGILVQPKAAATFGTSAGGPLAATLVLPNYATGEMLSFGSCAVTLGAAAAIGDLVTYMTTTGAIADTFAPIAHFTASQSTDTLTVSAITDGNIGVGSVIRSATAIIGTVTALGTGTGGTGTYTLNTSATVASAAMKCDSQATAANTALIPNARVDVLPLTAAGTAIITLTN